ncbi:MULTISPECIES: hypothetical protein [unclassified Rhizobium]|jgi:hypothetical protein|uniref:hypothetical protein n=1 Tax=unclassified Rhizobium TaxID=2613769 RepID=UPI000648668F|nr:MULTISPECIES: hypothetical protein [unclassified Rhizobium]MBN8954466.1 hypothetical protein [Rhizobium tropici]OJY77614.1 MAG: hypothetical protein BGP09_28625 [Rhizobium sp. 60-20]RKD56176.1 hypothetical protein BJ928_111105 [Rhizobium sp. WW_1]
MGKAYRIALSKLLLLVRLAIIVSLAGYTLSNANAAMHGSAFPEFRAEKLVDHGDHHAMQTDATGKHHDDASGLAKAKIAKQECCKDFCVGFGIVCNGYDAGGPAVSSIRQFIDDRHAPGERPNLDRPPNI